MDKETVVYKSTDDFPLKLLGYFLLSQFIYPGLCPEVLLIWPVSVLMALLLDPPGFPRDLEDYIQYTCMIPDFVTVPAPSTCLNFIPPI